MTRIYRIYGITRMINRIILLEISNPVNFLIPKIPVKNKVLDENYVEAVYLTGMTGAVTTRYENE